ncbi:PREDICTED: serpin B3-like [Gekko japonicus]|uniref:Serpin B3-like n=1 Tax=Gekko japonicus TaxID=146911 RepID=A0ABM1KX23_GEKJA|nr:PREDICTED: serpin B3-like [Gekko japonicus]
MSTLTEANTKFCVDLFKVLAKETPKKNVFFSPVSVSAALAMVQFGARGDTAKQMERALCFDEVTGSGSSPPAAGAQCDRPGGLHSQFKELMAAINRHTKNYALSIANRLYGAEQYEFLQQYLRCIKELHGAELERVDFQRATEEVRKKINSWVESQTNGKIKNLFPPDSITASTVLVLVNAIYFKGKWQREFKKTDTKEAPFWISQSQSKNVQMMCQKDVFHWAEIQTPPIQVLELPYDQGDLSMIILLPHGKEGLDQLQEELTYTKFKEWSCQSNMKKEKLDVCLPKFKLEENYLLPAPLQALGMKDVFSREKADLTGMSERRDLFVSAVVHKAYVEVNEEGTEAAAATGATIETTSARPGFRADRPFLFCIRHNKTQSILFVGTVRDP